MRSVFAWMLACCTTSLVVGAQQQTPTQPSDPKPAHEVFVLNGCLEATPEAAAVFRLTNASAQGELPAGAVTEPQPVGTSGKQATFELQAVSGVTAQGKDEDALRAHVGHRVEVTVRPVEAVASAPPASGAVTTPAPATASPKDVSPQRFTVTEIKSVAASCS
jgi:hypothetical protein